MSREDAWLGGATIVIFAALLLWVRDRYRDARHVPASDRDLTRRKDRAIANAFLMAIYAAASGFAAYDSADRRHRILFGMQALLALALGVWDLRRYVRLREEHRTDPSNKTQILPLR